MKSTRRERAGLPLYPDLNWITLHTIRSLPMPATNEEINEAVIGSLGLTEDQKAVLTPNGRQTEAAYRVGWCRTHLGAVGAIESAGRGLWRLTDDGAKMSEETVQHRYKDYLRRVRAQQVTKAPSTAGPDATTRGHRHENDAERDWTEDLLDRLLEMSPAAFGELARRLLIATGFEDVEVTGRSGDGGIDGTARYRFSLISVLVYFQCKRYASSVGPKIVREFRGALPSPNDRGLIITTGTFTKRAKEAATPPGYLPLDLIDGIGLCELLKEKRLGIDVRERTVEDVIIDPHYFDRFEKPSGR